MGRCRDGSCPSTASGSPGQEGSCPPHLDPSSRGATAFHPSPSLEGVTAQLGRPPFLKGSDAPFCLGTRSSFQGGSHWESGGSAGAGRIVQLNVGQWVPRGSPPPQPVSHPSGDRGPCSPGEQLLSLCPARQLPRQRGQNCPFPESFLGAFALQDQGQKGLRGGGCRSGVVVGAGLCP